MKFRIPSANWVRTAVCAVAVITAALTWNLWWPAAQSWVAETVSSFRQHSSVAHGSDKTDDLANPDPTDDSPHASHPAHASTVEATSLVLSDQAKRNVGLTPEFIRPIQLDTYRQSLTVPAVIVEKPGRTRIQISTPMTGVVTQVDVVKGEAVDPGARLFAMRLTHEDLVQGQTDFLKTLGELDVERREISRLEEATRSGAIPGKLLLNRQYARDKLTSLLNAQREALRLHGLTEQQVDRISRERRLLRELQIYAPRPDGTKKEELRLSRGPIAPVQYQEALPSNNVSLKPKTLLLQDLNVHEGQTVEAGETLCTLAAYDELYIEGQAFEQDIAQLRNASDRGWSVEAVLNSDANSIGIIKNLRIVYLANHIDTDSRTLHFYVGLPNLVTKDRRTDGGRFIEWKYLPGQRLQLRVPVNEWTDQIVLPIDAVAKQGAEYFVFQQNGEQFDRIPVHVKHRDQFAVVIENDGSLFPGDVVAMRGAHQLQMALKNKSGGGVDPHAGHSH